MAWERALVAAPDHLPAALRLLDWWRDEVTRAPSSAAYVEFAQAASRVLRRLPDHETAKIMSCVASIGLWLQEGGPVTPPVDSSAQELRRRADDGGIDPLAVWLLVQWNVRMSRTSSAAGDVKGETAAYLEEAAKVMETQLSRVPTNENLQSVAAQTWELLATTDPHNPIWLQRHRDAGSIARK
jgi:hypothetical protein